MKKGSYMIFTYSFLFLFSLFFLNSRHAKFDKYNCLYMHTITGASSHSNNLCKKYTYLYNCTNWKKSRSSITMFNLFVYFYTSLYKNSFLSFFFNKICAKTENRFLFCNESTISVAILLITF